MKLIDFETARREKKMIKRELEVEKYVLLADYELFDSWIEKEQDELNEKRINEAEKQVRFMKSLGHNHEEVFEDVIYYDPDDFMHDYKLDWLECIEAALTFYAYNRKNHKEMYELTIMAHYFIGPLGAP